MGKVQGRQKDRDLEEQRNPPSPRDPTLLSATITRTPFSGSPSTPLLELPL